MNPEPCRNLRKRIAALEAENARLKRVMGEQAAAIDSLLERKAGLARKEAQEEIARLRQENDSWSAQSMRQGARIGELLAENARLRERAETAERKCEEARVKALEEAAQIAEQFAAFTGVGYRDDGQLDQEPMPHLDHGTTMYARGNLNARNSIAAAIRALARTGKREESR